MTTFALAHGGWMGAWCWEMLTPCLQRFGHQVIAMDLPVDDPSATFEIYADAVCDEITSVTDDVVLVGHSLSGWTIPLVGARRSVKHLVYLCAVVPVCTDSFIEQMAREPDMFSSSMLATLGLSADPQWHRWSDVALARALMFADCDEDSAAAAIAQLRGQAIRPLELPYPLTDFPPARPHTCPAATTAWSTRVGPEKSQQNCVLNLSLCPEVTRLFCHDRLSWPLRCTNSPRPGCDIL